MSIVMFLHEHGRSFTCRSDASGETAYPPHYPRAKGPYLVGTMYLQDIEGDPIIPSTRC